LAPNPVHGDGPLRLYFAERPSSCHVAFYNLAGELIRKVATGEGGQPSISTQGLASGLYLLLVETEFDSGHKERFKQKIAVLK
jgi:hypothetical protein